MKKNQFQEMDADFVEKVVQEVKSQGVFDEFRKDSLADVDTKPAYQNLRNRVDSAVKSFLSEQKWTPETNKIQLREKLRKHISELTYLDVGVDRIVDQVVNPKIATVFEPKIEKIAYKYLGLPVPTPVREPPPQPIIPPPPLPPLNIQNSLLTVETTASFLPTDLEQISPDSDRSTVKSESKDDIKEEEDELPPGVDPSDLEPADEVISPPFEPLNDSKTIKTKPELIDTSEESKEIKIENKETDNAKAVEPAIKLEESIQREIERELANECLEAAASEETLLSRISSDSRLTMASVESLTELEVPANQNVNRLSVAANISEEAQMPKFNENSCDKDSKVSELHFDIKKDAIKFEGTERKNSMPGTSNGDRPSLEIEDAIMSEVKKNINVESSHPLEQLKLETPSTPHAEESSFGSFPEETQCSFDMKMADEEKPLEDEKVKDEKPLVDDNIQTPPAVEPTPKLTEQQSTLDTSRTDVTKIEATKPATPTSTSSSSRHKKHSKEKRHHSSDSSKHRRKSRSKDRDRSRDKSSHSHHSKHSSSSSSKHSYSSISKHSSHKSSKHDKQSSSSSRHESSHKKNDRSDNDKRHKHSSSRSDSREHSNATSSKRSDKNKSSTTSTNDDHNDVKTKTNRRKSNDSNEDDKRSSGGTSSGVGGGSGGSSSSVGSNGCASKKSSSTTSSAASSSTNVQTKNVPNESNAENETKSRNPLITVNEVVRLDDVLQNPETSYIDLKCSIGEVKTVVEPQINTKQTNSQKTPEKSSTNSEQLSSGDESDLQFFEENNVFESRLKLLQTLIENCHSVVEDLRKEPVSEETNPDSDDEIDETNTEDNPEESPPSPLPELQPTPQHRSRRRTMPHPSSAEESNVKTAPLNKQLALHIECRAQSRDNADNNSDAEPSKRKRTKRDEAKTSPALSDASVNSKENQAIVIPKDIVKGNRRHSRILSTSFTKLCQKQRYTNDDLYKPRPVLSQRSRRRRLDTVL